MTPLSEWSTFSEVLGSAAGALTGLQFVTMALISDMPSTPGDADASEAFSTPTIVHFGSVLFIAAVLSAPWHGIVAPATLWGLAGVAGVLYTLIVARRMRSQSAYHPVLEDWWFHAILPAVGYATLAVTVCLTPFHPRTAVFGVAFTAVLLLITGIHNSWDNVTFLVYRKRANMSLDSSASPDPHQHP